MDNIEKLYRLYQEHPEVTTDSRKCIPGSIFFALKGERFDGNQYAAEVLAKGCAYAVVDDAQVIPAGGDDRYFLVPDVLTALQELAAYHRQQLNIPVIGITGTNGKTTTKELTLAVLSQKYKVLATCGNLNNQIGVPLTLLSVRPEHEMAIIEMGANHPMDIADLCAIVRPDFGLITNVGKAHLLGFGSLEGVVAAKTKLYDSLRQTKGTAFVDAGNALLVPHTDGLKTIPYGADAEVHGAIVDCSPFLHLDLTIGASHVDVQTHLIGGYNLINIVAASAVGHHFGVSDEQIKAAIEGYQPQNMRSQLVDLGHGNNLILDAYNANPTSMAAAISSLVLNPASHKNLILGDMRELGEESANEHARILHLLVESETKFDSVLLVGQEFYKAYRALTDAEAVALAKHNSSCYADVAALCADDVTLSNLCGTTLIKGSRGIQLEKVVEKFKK
ncbi:MAG: UDP-N-acetylmuramoyl-tripeptide--D-alanyl-D-alanine ligase [Bacteroidales bacterium]|nr:UDP-N-acetylmuramoyl-tripeptide--D-alanyl-D-alanine ligase [Bacteroidales bacterium]